MLVDAFSFIVIQSSGNLLATFMAQFLLLNLKTGTMFLIVIKVLALFQTTLFRGLQISTSETLISGQKAVS